MKRKKNPQSLKKIYYRSFFSLIVIPILLVFTAAISVTAYMMRKAAIDNIQNTQINIAASLSEEIRQISLQLSHFVYVNNNEIMELAANAHTRDAEKRYEYTGQLTEAFQVAMVPKQNIISSTFFMKDNGSIYLKDEIMIARDKLERAEWYRNALKTPNRVSVGSYDTSVSTLTHTGIRKNQLILAAALSPDVAVDRSGKIEMVTLFSISKTAALMKQYNQTKLLGTSVITDNGGNLIFGSGMDEEAAGFMAELPGKAPGVYQCRLSGENMSESEKYTYVLNEIADSDWLLVTYIKSSRITEEFNRVAMLLILTIGVLFVLFYGFSQYFLKNIIHPIHHMVDGLNQVEAGDFKIYIEPEGQYEIRNMIHSFNRMAGRLNRSIKEKEEAQKMKHEAEIKALQSQINPHFLVNTLNSIRFMAQVARFDGIRKMAEALIRILSCSFRSNTSFYTIAEELEVLDSYVYLMKIRYSDGFQVDYQVDEQCRSYWIPRLILQPIVENSIVHGFENTGEDIGHLEIEIWQSDGCVFLKVTDDGRGMTEAQLKELLGRKGRGDSDNYNIGIENVYTRLKLYFGENCSLSVESTEGVNTMVTIKLPAVKNAEGVQGYRDETGSDN